MKNLKVFLVVKILFLLLTNIKAQFSWQSNNRAIYSEKCDLYGHDFAVVITTDRFQCQDKCYQTLGCTHFVWSHGNCYLKNGVIYLENATYYNDLQVTCGIIDDKYTEIQWNGNNWARKCDFSGTIISQLAISTAELCSKKCYQTLGCTHFVWFRGTCYLKTGDIKKNDASLYNHFLIFCGVQVNWYGGNLAENCDFPGNDFYQINNTSAWECVKWCFKSNNCTHFVWSSSTFSSINDVSKCYLKIGAYNKETALFFKSEDRDVVCGVKDYFGSNWMSSNLQTIGNFKPTELCMPGSHNAGMNQNTETNNVAPDCAVITQSRDIKEQLMNGVRYFDIRPVIYLGNYHTGHYSYHKTLHWLGGRGQTISNIIQQINEFTATNKELIILYVSHDYNIDKGYRSFNDSEWSEFFNKIAALNYLFSNPKNSKVLTNYKLNDFIGNGQASVLVIVEPSDKTQDITKYNGSRVYSMSYNFWIYDDYANVSDYDLMKSDQFEKLQNNSMYGELVHLISWTLTQSDEQAGSCKFNFGKSVLGLAQIANTNSFEILDNISSTRYPNVILTDDAANTNILGLCGFIYTCLYYL